MSAVLVFLALAPSAHQLFHWFEDSDSLEHVHSSETRHSVCSEEAHHCCDSCQIVEKQPAWTQAQSAGSSTPDLRSTLLRGLSSGLWNVFRASASDRAPPSER